jgi:hypothetical protein
MKTRITGIALIGLALVLLGTVTDTTAQGPSPWQQVLALLTDSQFGLEAIKSDVAAIEAEVTDPGHGLAEIKREIRAIEERLAPPTTFRLSSGLFGLPADAASVDWMVVNNSATAQTFTVTVFRAGVGPKTVVAPGALVVTVDPGATTHNANSVGFSAPFVPGFYYEVVLEATDPNVLPSVHVWQDDVNTVIPGTLIPPGNWVRLQ